MSEEEVKSPKQAATGGIEMFKKTAVVLLILLLAISLTALIGCGEKKEAGTTVEETSPKTTTTQTQAQTSPVVPIETQPVVTSPPPPPAEVMVVLTRTGEKYHNAGCQYVVNKTDTRTVPLSQAKAEGYTPCSVCGPPQ